MNANGQFWSAGTCHRFGFRILFCQKQRSCGDGSIGKKKAATSRRTPKSMRDSGRSVCGVQVTAACTRKTGKDQAVVGQFELAPLPCPEMAKQTSWPGHDRIPIGTARTPGLKAMSDHNAHDPTAHKTTKQPIPAKDHLTRLLFIFLSRLTPTPHVQGASLSGVLSGARGFCFRSAGPKPVPGPLALSRNGGLSLRVCW